MFRQQCGNCRSIWNAAFGIVGTTVIAKSPHECPFCFSPEITKYDDGWQLTDGSIFPTRNDQRISIVKELQ